MEKEIKYWCAVVSKNHVDIGVKEGIVQACHGKKAPLNRMSYGDYIVYYSPKLDMNDNAPYQFFTAVGKVLEQPAYQVDFGNGFKPYRKHVQFFEVTQIVSLKKVVSAIEQNENEKPQWKSYIRFGFFELPKNHFEKIAELMLKTKNFHQVPQKV